MRDPLIKAADRCGGWDTRGDAPVSEPVSLPASPIGGLSCLCLRALEGDIAQSSPVPVICTSVVESSAGHGYGAASAGRAGATELRKGTRTDSSISSYMILTASSSSAGSGGAVSQDSDTRRSRT